MAEGDSIDFMAKYGSWVAVRRMSVYGNTTPEEVVMHLAGIRQTLDRKAFELLGVDTTALDSFSDNLTSEGRKSIANLTEALNKMGSAEAKDAVVKACKGKEELKEIASTYLFRRIVQNLKYDFDVNQEMLVRAYPNLKLPKQRGRKPKA